MNKNESIKYFLYAIVGLNLLVLSGAFLVPRTQVMVSQWGMSMDEKLETHGAPDMPNTLSESFIMMNKIKAHTEPESSVYFPPLKEGEHRSPAIKVLYPRKIFQSEAGGSESLFPEPEKSAPIYLVVGPEWNAGACAEKPTLELGVWDYRMCRLN